MKEHEERGKAAVGCLMIILFIYMFPLIIALLKGLAVIAFFGGLGFLAYKVFQLNQKTEFLSIFFRKHFSRREKDIEIGENTFLTLPKPQREKKSDFSQTILDLKKEIDDLRIENERAQATRAKDIEKALNIFSTEIDEKNKKDLLSDLFGDQPQEYDQSEEFEKRKYQNQVKKQKDELEIESLKLNLDKQLFEQDQTIYEYKKEAEEDRHHIRLEMQDGFLKVGERFLYLEKEINTFKGLVIEKFTHMETQVAKELGYVREMIGNLRLEVKQELSDTKVMVGREILRLDKQQLALVGQLENCVNQVGAFGNEMQKLKIHAEKFAIRGEDMLNRANIIYQKHKTDISVMSNNLNTGLQQMALHKGDFALTVGKSKMMMDELSNDHYFALKNIAMEKVGVNMLRQDFQQRYELQHQKIQNLVTEKRHINEKISENLSRGREVNGLRHQLGMTQENLRHTDNRAKLMRQEHAIMEKLSK